MTGSNVNSDSLLQGLAGEDDVSPRLMHTYRRLEIIQQTHL